MSAMKRHELQAWKRKINELDGPDLDLVERMLSDRLAVLEENRRKEKEARRIAEKRPRGRPPRTDIDRAAIIAALARSSGKIRSAARELGVPTNTLARHARRIPAAELAAAVVSADGKTGKRP